MRLKLLKDIRMQGAPTVQILAGAIVDASEETAKAWMSAGVAVPANNVETAMPKTVTETAVTDSVTDKKRAQGRERVRRYRKKLKSVTFNGG
jgi:hypothetical protein